jgi:site-specific DNA recombinase
MGCMLRQQPIDIRKLRYVLYARKSTEDDGRQIRSIDDQIRDCKKLAADQGLHVVGEPIRESKSAKKPGQRPKFTQILKDLEAKKYDGILCWHPDRLCRNMLEGGQVINMLDEGVLKDIRFHSHQFSNDANGKMLLGMLFVFSKQYSDDLSEKVNRGNQGNFDEGKSAGTPKWGYIRDEATGLYAPSPFFDDIKEAWNRRLQGQSYRTIARFLSEKNVHRMTKDVKASQKDCALRIDGGQYVS